MGNTISAATLTNTSLDLANGDTKVKKNLEVVGVSTFTGKSTFNGDLSVTNGKFNNIDVPTLSTDVSTLKTNVTSLQTTVTNVSTGSFTGKAISGATDVTATGTGQFNAVKTNNIDINGEIQSTTGKKYVTSSTTGLSFTNGIASGQPANATINLKSDGGIELTHGTGKSIDIGKNSDGSAALLECKTGILGSINANGFLTVSNTLRANDRLFVSGDSTLVGSVAANGGIVVPQGKTLTANGGITSSTLTVNNATTLTGAVTAAGDLNAKNVIIGTNKWLIEETVDANKGTRLCFGKVDTQATGGKRFYTCMNNSGNLELF